MKTSASSSVVQKCFAVLDVLGQHGGKTFTELVVATNFPKSTLHRVLGSLVAEGAVQFSELQQTYTLGMRLLVWARHAWQDIDVRQLAQEEMKRLNEATGETVHLAVLNGDRIVYIDKLESLNQVRMYSAVGKQGPVYCTGVGKAIVAFLPEKKREELISKLDFKRYTANTITDEKSFRRELEAIRERGYARDDGEHEDEIQCVAAPILNFEGVSVAGISVSAPEYRISPETISNWIDETMKAATEISQYAGKRPEVAV